MTYKKILLAVTFCALVQIDIKLAVRKPFCMCDTANYSKHLGHRGTDEWTGTS